MRQKSLMYVYGRGVAILALVAAGLGVAACTIVVSSRTEVTPLDHGGFANYTVTSPVRAHMMNGDVVLFRRGAVMSATHATGTGERLDATRRVWSMARSVPLDSVIGLESFVRHVIPERTLVYAPVSAVVTGVGGLIIVGALFGSCPTIYVDSAGTPALQAESFSYSIAPLLARRDVDRLNVRADSNGVVRLEVRNEALETHYIDQLELLEVRHDDDETVLPAARSGLVAVKELAEVTEVRDARGRDVSRLVARADGNVFGSDPALLGDAAGGRVPAEDYLDFAVPRRGMRDSLALVLTMRSSLMSTTIFYEHMLARGGARSLDWIGNDLTRITAAAKVARWYTSNFGLRVLVRDGAEWRQVVRLMDFGPVAWRNVAAILPPTSGDTVHVRLAFVPDEWRIDRLVVTRTMRSVQPRALAIGRVIASDGSSRSDARDYLAKADDRHLVTEPGNRFYAEFDAGQTRETRTFLLAAEGYYIEWMRPAWLAKGSDTSPFSTRTTKQDILRSWRANKDTLEARFYRDRVPVL